MIGQEKPPCVMRTADDGLKPGDFSGIQSMKNGRTHLAGAGVGGGVGGQEYHLLTGLHLRTETPCKRVRFSLASQATKNNNAENCKKRRQRRAARNSATFKPSHHSLLHTACQHVTHALDFVDARDGHAHGGAHRALWHSAHLVEHIVHLPTWQRPTFWLADLSKRMPFKEKYNDLAQKRYPRGWSRCQPPRPGPSTNPCSRTSSAGCPPSSRRWASRGCSSQ